MTREAFENAMTIVVALGGSTNAVLHLLAMARSVNVPLTLNDFQSTSNRVEYLADLKPSGKFVQEDLHSIGGTPGVMKYLLAEGLLSGDCMTVTGKTLAENLKDLPGLKPGQTIGTTDEIGLRAVDRPIHVHDIHATILHLLGLNHLQLTYLHNGRSERPTLVAGNLIQEIYS